MEFRGCWHVFISDTVEDYSGTIDRYVSGELADLILNTFDSTFISGLGTTVVTVGARSMR